jgi:hypothetical protein
MEPACQRRQADRKVLGGSRERWRATSIGSNDKQVSTEYRADQSGSAPPPTGFAQSELVARLAPETMEAIKSEEIFRHEIQQQLTSAQSTGSLAKRVYLFLNTPLGLWFLSSFALALLVHFYATMESHLDGLRQKRENVEWLDLEINHHLEQLKHLFGEDLPLPNPGEPLRLYLNDIVLHVVGSDRGYTPIFKEGAGLSLHSLMYQLAHSVDDKEEKKSITNAAHAASDFLEVVQNHLGQTPDFEVDRNFQTNFKPLTDPEGIKQWESKVRKELDVIRNHPSYARMKLPRWSSSHSRH